MAQRKNCQITVSLEPTIKQKLDGAITEETISERVRALIIEWLLRTEHLTTDELRQVVV